MPSTNKDSSRIWLRLSDDQFKQLDEARAEKGQERTDWLRHVIMRELSGQAQHERDLEQALAKRMSRENAQMLQDVCHRIDQLETRMFHENSAMIHLGFTILWHLATASVAAQAAATPTGFYDEDGAEEMRSTIEMAGQALYERAHAEVKPILQELRDKARDKAKGLSRANHTAPEERNVPS